MAQQTVQNMQPLTWFEIPATDLSRAVRFYETVLAVTLKLDAMGPSQLAIFPYDKPAGGGCLTAGPGAQPSAAGVMIYLNAAPSLDAALSRVTAAGGEVVVPRTELPPGLGAFARVRDTEGNLVGLHQLA
jgi:uncharacterized protein